MADNIHSEHRNRVRKEFLQYGFKDGMSEHKLLEMLLFFSIPRKDTNPLAHELINRFGTVDAVFEASPEELMKVEGVGENTAMLLKLVIPTAKMYINAKTKKVNVYDNINSISEFLTAKYLGFNNEVFALTTFNSKGAMLGFDILGEGDTAMVDVSMRRVLETVLKRNAVCAIMSHNHPGGTAIPTVDDLETTEKIAKTLESINVRLLDHIIICDDDYVSLAQSKAFKHIFR